MKIILTEEQIVKLAQIEEIYSFICNPLNEGINLNILKKKIKKLLKSGVSIGLIYLNLLHDLLLNTLSSDTSFSPQHSFDTINIKNKLFETKKRRPVDYQTPLSHCL